MEKKPIGRPKLDMSIDDILVMYNEIGSWQVVADTLGVSRMTLFRRLKENNVKRTYQKSVAVNQ